MKQFIKQILTDVDGNPSSKRVVMFMFVIVFLFVTLYNMYTGKAPIESIQTQLDYAMLWALTAVFGEKVVAAFKKPEQQ